MNATVELLKDSTTKIIIERERERESSKEADNIYESWMWCQIISALFQLK